MIVSVPSVDFTPVRVCLVVVVSVTLWKLPVAELTILPSPIRSPCWNVVPFQTVCHEPHSYANAESLATPSINAHASLSPPILTVTSGFLF